MCKKEIRDKLITARFTKAEYKKIEKHCKKGLSFSDFIRGAALQNLVVNQNQNGDS